MAKHDRTLKALCVTPIRLNIAWGDLLGLLGHLGAAVSPGGGSMYTIRLNGLTIVLHAPHPGREIPAAMVRRVRQFLDDAGVEHP